MAKFNLDEYETVAERIKRLHKELPDARIIPELVQGDEGSCTFKCTIYKNVEEQEMKLPLAVGYAHELSPANGGNPNVAAFYENCSTSAIGRAIANSIIGQIGRTADKRPSREEMIAISDNAPESPTQSVSGGNLADYARDELNLKEVAKAPPLPYEEDYQEQPPEYGETPPQAELKKGSVVGKIDAYGDKPELPIPANFKCPKADQGYGCTTAGSGYGLNLHHKVPKGGKFMDRDVVSCWNKNSETGPDGKALDWCNWEGLLEDWRRNLEAVQNG